MIWRVLQTNGVGIIVLWTICLLTILLRAYFIYDNYMWQIERGENMPNNDDISVATTYNGSSSDLFTMNNGRIVIAQGMPAHNHSIDMMDDDMVKNTEDFMAGNPYDPYVCMNTAISRPRTSGIVGKCMSIYSICPNIPIMTMAAGAPPQVSILYWSLMNSDPIPDNAEFVPILLNYSLQIDVDGPYNGSDTICREVNIPVELINQCFTDVMNGVFIFDSAAFHSFQEYMITELMKKKDNPFLLKPSKQYNDILESSGYVFLNKKHKPITYKAINPEQTGLQNNYLFHILSTGISDSKEQEYTYLFIYNKKNKTKYRFSIIGQYLKYLNYRPITSTDIGNISIDDLSQMSDKKFMELIFENLSILARNEQALYISDTQDIPSDTSKYTTHFRGLDI